MITKLIETTHTPPAKHQKPIELSELRADLLNTPLCKQITLLGHDKWPAIDQYSAVKQIVLSQWASTHQTDDANNGVCGGQNIRGMSKYWMCFKFVNHIPSYSWIKRSPVPCPVLSVSAHNDDDLLLRPRDWAAPRRPQRASFLSLTCLPVGSLSAGGGWCWSCKNRLVGLLEADANT